MWSVTEVIGFGNCIEYEEDQNDNEVERQKRVCQKQKKSFEPLASRLDQKVTYTVAIYG